LRSLLENFSAEGSNPFSFKVFFRIKILGTPQLIHLMHSLFICLIFSSLINSCLCAQVLQITDFHFDKDYDQYGDITNFCHRSGNEPQREDIGEFGNYHCDSPEVKIQKQNYRVRQNKPVT
jgi:hypothetical protein